MSSSLSQPVPQTGPGIHEALHSIAKTEKKCTVQPTQTSFILNIGAPVALSPNATVYKMEVGGPALCLYNETNKHFKISSD